MAVVRLHRRAYAALQALRPADTYSTKCHQGTFWGRLRPSIALFVDPVLRQMQCLLVWSQKPISFYNSLLVEEHTLRSPRLEHHGIMNVKIDVP